MKKKKRQGTAGAGRQSGVTLMPGGLAESWPQGSHSRAEVAPCTFSFHLDRNGGVGPVIWPSPKANLAFFRISVLNTFVLISPLLSLPTNRKKVIRGTAWVEPLWDRDAPGFSRRTN